MLRIVLCLGIAAVVTGAAGAQAPAGDYRGVIDLLLADDLRGAVAGAEALSKKSPTLENLGLYQAVLVAAGRDREAEGVGKRIDSLYKERKSAGKPVPVRVARRAMRVRGAVVVGFSYFERRRSLQTGGTTYYAYHVELKDKPTRAYVLEKTPGTEIFRLQRDTTEPGGGAVTQVYGKKLPSFRTVFDDLAKREGASRPGGSTRGPR